MADVVVVGQIGRDLVLRVPALPDPGGSVTAGERREMLGGKGANQAVALRQLGVPVALVGVVGTDAAGAAVLDQARADGIDVGPVVRRRGPTALLLDLVEDGGRRRLVESVPEEMLLTADDVAASEERIRGCRVLSLQLQQPGVAVRAALERAPATGLVVADGAPGDEPTRTALLARADVLRADRTEVALLLGRRPDGVEELREAAVELLTAGPRLVSLDAGEAGNLVAWRSGPAPGRADGLTEVDPRWADGDVLVPLIGGPAVDPTGAGDASVAALAAALLGRAAPEAAAWAAAAAAALTVGHAGGRPALTPARLGEVLRERRRPRF